MILFYEMCLDKKKREKLKNYLSVIYGINNTKKKSVQVSFQVYMCMEREREYVIFSLNPKNIQL